MARAIKSAPATVRTILCIYCRRAQQVGQQAMSLPCRYCHKALVLEDVRIAGYAARSVIETCGAVLIGPAGEVTAGTVTCASLQLAGKLKGNVVSLGPVSIAASGFLRGDITAPSVTLADGARVKGRMVIG
jgi:hypothetical protein